MVMLARPGMDSRLAWDLVGYREHWTLEVVLFKESLIMPSLPVFFPFYFEAKTSPQ